MLIAHNGASDTLYGELFRFVVHQLFVYLLGQYLASMHALNSKPPCLPYSAVPNRPNVSVTFLNKCQNRLTNNNFTRIKFLQSLSTSQCGQRVFHTFFCKSLGTRSQHKFAFFVLFFFGAKFHNGHLSFSLIDSIFTENVIQITNCATQFDISRGSLKSSASVIKWREREPNKECVRLLSSFQSKRMKRSA